MTLQIELDPATEARLTAEAHDKGLDLLTYASELLGGKPAANPTAKPAFTIQQFRAMRQRIARLGPEDMPSASETWPRSVIYSDHD